MPRHQAPASAETVPGPAVQQTASAKAMASARASSPEPIVWPLGTASATPQVAAMLGRQAPASAEAAPGSPAETLARPFRAAQAAAHPAASAQPAPQDAAGAAAVGVAAEHAAAVAAQHAGAAVAEAAPQASVAAGVAAAAARASPGVPQRAALALPALALPSPLACHRDQALPWPARPPSARFARATEGWRSALP
jgi:hypothetical protein